MDQRSALRFLAVHFVLTALLLGGSWWFAKSTQTPALFAFGLPLRIFDIIVVLNPTGGWESWVLDLYWFNLLVDFVSPALFAAAVSLQMKAWKRFAIGGAILLLMAAAFVTSEGARWSHEERDFKPLHWTTEK
jgi:hypothetical protein